MKKIPIPRIKQHIFSTAVEPIMQMNIYPGIMQTLRRTIQLIGQVQQQSQFITAPINRTKQREYPRQSVRDIMPRIQNPEYLNNFSNLRRLINGGVTAPATVLQNPIITNLENFLQDPINILPIPNVVVPQLNINPPIGMRVDYFIPEWFFHL